MNTINPCKDCGCDKPLVDGVEANYGAPMNFVTCPECWKSGPIKPSADDAILAWNKRNKLSKEEE